MKTKILIRVLLITMILIPAFAFSQGIHKKAEEGDLEAVKTLLEGNPDLVNVEDTRGNTPLHFAAQYGHYELVAFLTDKGATLNARNNAGQTPLFSAMLGRQYEIMKFLLLKSDVNDTFDLDMTPVHFAVMYRDTELIKTLLSKDPNLNVSAGNGTTPLISAIGTGEKSLVELLITSGADINMRSSEGMAPLHSAAIDDKNSLIELLAAKGAYIDVKDDNGATPLYYAIISGRKEAVQSLIEKGAKVNVRNNQGETPLHMAAIAGYCELVDLLISEGADVNAKDSTEKTPLCLAVEYGHQKISDLLNRKSLNEVDLNTKFNELSSLNKRLSEGEAKIWYLGHSGWAVKTKRKLLIFDYYEYGKNPDEPRIANGRINTDEIKDLDVFVFISHAHRDHFDKTILEWDQTIDNIKYIFCWKALDVPNYVYLSDDRDEKTIDRMTVTKINSKVEPGGAFLVNVDGLIIYHGGDYYYSEDDGGDFAYLLGKYGRVDIAFIESGFEHICDHTIRELQPLVVCPMHARNKEIRYKRYAEKSAVINPCIRFICAKNRGDNFLYPK